jgi:hypothetical protein
VLDQLGRKPGQRLELAERAAHLELQLAVGVAARAQPLPEQNGSGLETTSTATLALRFACPNVTAGETAAAPSSAMTLRRLTLMSLPARILRGPVSFVISRA